MSNNSLIIRLNPEALNSLFPEGSEARVQLQNSVLTQAAGQFVKGQLTPEVKEFLTAAVAKVAAHIDLEQHIAAAFARKNGWTSDLQVKDGSNMAQAIAERVKQEFESKHSERVDALVKHRASLILDDLDARIERSINAEVIRVADQRINERVRLALATASQAINQA
jgi:hypothetical protein